jgi:hypothetical protein
MCQILRAMSLLQAWLSPSLGLSCIAPLRSKTMGKGVLPLFHPAIEVYPAERHLKKLEQLLLG